MQTGDWTLLAEKRVYAHPATEEVAKEALEWIAANEGKSLRQLVDEIRGHDQRPQGYKGTPCAPSWLQGVRPLGT
jgi:hypothetical protein